MGEPSLRELERDVEVARSKLARDLSTLRSPDTYSQFTSTLKDEAVSAKDALLDKARASAQSAVESFVEELKARAAANPTAALAIGAGIAWRLIQRPPIATALIGAGLISLMRTNATHVNGRTNREYLAEATDRLRDQATDFAADVKEQAGRAFEAASDQVAEVASAAKERAGDAVQAAAEQVGDLASAAKERVQDWGNQATSAMRETAAQVKEQTASATGQTTDRISQLRQPGVRVAEAGASSINALSTTVQNAVSDRETRDSFLLGAASVAVIAALGIACQRKLGETAQTD